MKSKGLKLFPCLSPLAGAAFYCLAMLSPTSDLQYMRGAAYVCLLVYLALSTALGACLLCKYGQHLIPTPINTTTGRCLGLLCSIGFWFLALHALNLSQTEEGRAALFALLCAPFALIGGLYPALEGFGVRTELSCLCGMGGAISLVSYTMYLYFDASTPKNSTYKLLLSLALLVGVLYLLSRVRSALGKRTAPAVTATVKALAYTLAGSLGFGSILGVLLPGHELPLGQHPTYFLALFFLLIIKDILFKYQPCPAEAKTTDDEVSCE